MARAQPNRGWESAKEAVGKLTRPERRMLLRWMVETAFEDLEPQTPDQVRLLERVNARLEEMVRVLADDLFRVDQALEANRDLHFARWQATAELAAAERGEWTRQALRRLAELGTTQADRALVSRGHVLLTGHDLARGWVAGGADPRPTRRAS